MHFSTAPLRRGSLFAPLAVASALLLAGAAQAENPDQQMQVHSPGKAWDPGFTYAARFDLDGRSAPQLNPVAKVNYVRQRQWVYIKCQTNGGYAYGSTIWDKVNFDGGHKALYVPDAFLRTYTTGFIELAPPCSSST